MSPDHGAGLRIEVGRQIVVQKGQLPGLVTRFLRDKLFILNSEYIVKQCLGKPLYDVPKFFDLIERETACLRLPRGFLGQLTAFLTEKRIAHHVAYCFPQFAPCAYSSTIELRPEQERMAQQALAAGHGVLVAPPGSGKTIVGLELIARHQLPALILTHRKQLLDQWVEQIMAGLLQSFARAKDLAELADKFGVIIVDECHHIPAVTFRKVISNFMPRTCTG